jgi:hypothetical protein
MAPLLMEAWQNGVVFHEMEEFVAYAQNRIKLDEP